MKKRIEFIDGSSATVGDRVRIHPGSDYFMMGAKYGRITSVTKDCTAAYVKLEVNGRDVTRRPVAIGAWHLLGKAE